MNSAYVEQVDGAYRIAGSRVSLDSIVYAFLNGESPEPTIDFQTAHAANLEGKSDLDVLASAAKESRVLVTHDRRTMPYHFAEFIANETSAGVILVSQELPVVDIAEDLILIWTATEAEE
jgi:hypothetical protein